MSEVSERCEEGCDFEWSLVSSSDIAPRIIKSSAAIADLITAGANPHSRKSQNVWSPIEYAGHVRDVLFNLRDRLVVAINEDNPLCKGLFGTPRIDLGLYVGDEPYVVAEELRVAASLFARTWDRIPDVLRDRTMVYGYPRPADRSLRWVASQALHEVEHHFVDVRDGLVDS